MKKCIYKVLILLSFIAFIYLFTNNCYAIEDNLVYINDVNKYSNQDEVTIKVCANNLDNSIVTLGLHVKYDKSKLQFVRAQKGDDLEASLYLAENFDDESKVGIGMISSSGFKNNGVYYEVKFKVLDSSSDIPITLALKEASDSKGNNVNLNLQSGTIKIVKEETNVTEEKSPENQEIKTFELNTVDLTDNLDTLIKEKGNIEVADNDYLVYETENSKVAEILDDGTIIPIADGTTNVRVKLNDDTIGNVEVTVKNGKVESIKASNEKLSFESQASTVNGTVSQVEENTTNSIEIIEMDSKTNQIDTNQNEIINKENNENLENNNRLNGKVIILIVIITIIILLLIFKIFINKNKKNRKRYSKK